MSTELCSTPVVLLVDDDRDSTRTLARSLSALNESYCYLQVDSAGAALEETARRSPEVAVVDLSLDPLIGPESGLALIPQLECINPCIRVLVLTGHDGPEYGMKSVRAGAASFVGKPADPAHLYSLIRDGIEFSRLKRSYCELAHAPSGLQAQTGLSSRSASMQPVLESVAYAASNKLPVLLIGETGTGKGLTARAIHRAGPRPRSEFIRFQPTYGSPDMVASELFGHKRGSFTGATGDRKGLIEESAGGTLFIDEIDELPAEIQVLLLNVLQEKRFRRVGENRELSAEFRLISATNCRHDRLLSERKLRPDFYHRIAHCTIEIPPLRQRMEDLPDLAAGFLHELATREKLAVQGFAKSAEQRLLGHHWPGNVRELQAVVHGGAYRAQYHRRRYIEASDLAIREPDSPAAGRAAPFRERVRNFELKLVQDALRQCGNNQQHAADLLGLNRCSLRRIVSRGSG